MYCMVCSSSAHTPQNEMELTIGTHNPLALGRDEIPAFDKPMFFSGSHQRFRRGLRALDLPTDTSSVVLEGSKYRQ